MPTYDLKQLSSRDFEELTRDLLQAEWNVTLEAFRVGRDQGIDLRHLPAEGGATIVQCKHYAVSGYAKLHTHLKNNEVDKVRKLKPARYVLVTSVELTDNNKKTLKEQFSPFILTPKDIYGAQDIEGLLQRHPAVLRSNFKLWLTSTEILERVLHNAERCRTEFEVKRVMAKLPIFVQSASYPRALEILDKTGLVVISGVPGIGKTTLAEILLYTHLEQGYEPVVIENDLREGKRLFNSTRRQIFYFDDFLGQTFMGEGRFPGGMNNDVSLVIFVEMIKATKKSRFILTTREHLLQGARAVSERLRHSVLMDSRCLLDLGDYSKGQRARILYNHLYFSDLPREYKEQMLKEDFFLAVIAHEHFNPRLVEWISSAARLKNVVAAEYQPHVTKLLAHPQEIWSHAFNHQISLASRNLLFVLYSKGWPNLSEVESAWKSLNALTARKYSCSILPKDYQSALKELDNAFVEYEGGRVRFLNPSVREMVGAEIADFPQHALDLLVTADRFGQIDRLFDLAQLEGNENLFKTLSDNVKLVSANMARLMNTPSVRWEPHGDGRTYGTYIDLAVEERVVRLGRIGHVLQSETLHALFVTGMQTLVATYAQVGGDISDVAPVLEAFDKYPQLKMGKGAKLQRNLLDAILNNGSIRWAAHISVLIDVSKSVSIWTPDDEIKFARKLAWYKYGGVELEYRQCSDIDAFEQFRGELETLRQKIGHPFSKKMRQLKDRISELKGLEHGLDREGSSVRSIPKPPANSEADSDAGIRDVFASLLD